MSARFKVRQPVISIPPRTTPATDPVPPPSMVFRPQDPRELGIGQGGFISYSGTLLDNPVPVSQPTPVIIATPTDPPRLPQGMVVNLRGGAATLIPVPHVIANVSAADVDPVSRRMPGAAVTAIGGVPTVGTIPPACPVVVAQQEWRMPHPGGVFQFLGGVTTAPLVPSATQPVLCNPTPPPPFSGSVLTAIGGIPSVSTTPVAVPVVVAQQEPRRPETGAFFQSIGGVPSTSIAPPVIPTIVAQQESARPAVGWFFTAIGGQETFVAPRPGVIVQREEQRPFQGSVFVTAAIPPSPSLIPAAIPIVVAQREDVRPIIRDFGGSFVYQTGWVRPFLPPLVIDRFNIDFEIHDVFSVSFIVADKFDVQQTIIDTFNVGD